MNPTRSPFLGATVALVTALLGVTVLDAPGAHAAPATPVVTSFSTPGGPYDWMVPAGVRRIHVDAVGGSGATSTYSSHQGGAGGHVVADIPVVGGSTLHVHVAGNGSVNGGGSNGGGDGAGSGNPFQGGGGGGASDLRTDGDALSDRTFVVAGGGGSAVWGGAGAAAQSAPASSCYPPAQAGTDTTGGGGGSGCGAGSNGQPGTSGSGGVAGQYSGGNDYGGGGGGGWYGGGGGGGYGGGAGGSNRLDGRALNVTQDLGTFRQAPYVQISYVLPVPPATTLVVSAADTSLPADGTSTTEVTATVTDEIGDGVPAEAVGFSSDDAGVQFGTVSDHADGTYTATMTSSTAGGTATITGSDTSVPGVSGSTAIAISPLGQVVAFDSTAPVSATIGETYVPTAHGGGSGSPVSFSLDPSTSGWGTATAACSLAGSTVSLDHAGTCVTNADQAGNAQYDAAPTSQQSIAVGQGSSTSRVAVAAGAMTATVRPVAPATSVPTGTVTFAVDGSPVGSAPLVSGVATLHHPLPSGASPGVSAIYSGDSDYLGSSATSPAVHAPGITAQRHSWSTRTRYGWYRSPVTVTFRCVPNGSPLAAACPVPVTLRRNAAGQSVTRTVLSQDGGAATVSVSSINIDMVRPEATVLLRDGTARCTGYDALSGLAGCTVTGSRHRGSMRYLGKAIDRAGNTGMASRSHRGTRLFIAHTRRPSGTYHLITGRTYTLVTRTHDSSPPRVFGAVRAGQPTGPDSTPMRAGGRHHGLRTWKLRFGVHGLDSSHTWVLVVRVGGQLRHVQFQTVP
jgi:hypothetical protein